MGDAPYVKLRDLVSPGRSISYGIVQPGEHHWDGVPILRVGDIRQNGIDGSAPLKVSASVEAGYARTRLRGGELLMTLVGTVGQMAIVPKAMSGWNVARAVAVIPVRDDPGAAWVRLALTAPEARSLIDSRLNTTVQATLNLGDLAELPVLLPPLESRVQIMAHIGGLDDKIELNRRLSETLEKMAQALFEASFGAPETEHAPRVLGDVADVIDCLHSKKPHRRDVGRPLLHLGNIRDDGLLDISDAYLIDDRDYEIWTSRVEARPGDCVITNVGRVGAVAQIPSGVSAALGRNMTAVRCRPDFPYPTFVLEALRSDAMRAEIERKTDAGTILSALNVRNIPTLQMPALDRERIEQYERFARPLRARMETALAENHALRKTRDALLPRLLSGAVPA